jgi:hypothetical protein
METAAVSRRLTGAKYMIISGKTISSFSIKKFSVISNGLTTDKDQVLLHYIKLRKCHLTSRVSQIFKNT